LTYLCDTHCHLYLEAFNNDLKSVLQNAREANVNRLLIPGIDLQTSKAAIELAKKYPHHIYSAVGIHPNSASGIKSDEIYKIKILLENNSKIVAVGEIGLDFFRTWANPDDQKFVLKNMLALAAQFQLPVCLHVREAEQEIVNIMDEWYAGLESQNLPLSRNPGVFHSYSGSPIIAQWAINHHFRFGISGSVTYPKNNMLRQMIPQIGLENIVLETDSPYLPPQRLRGKRNEPSNVNIIAEELSILLQMDRSKVIEKTSKNAELLFHWE